MDEKEFDELKLIQSSLHEALEKGYPPLGKGGINNPPGAKKNCRGFIRHPTNYTC